MSVGLGAVVPAGIRNEAGRYSEDAGFSHARPI
jgi:hypothetical protein